MTAYATISLQDYWQTGRSDLTIPVVEDDSLPLSDSLRNLLKPGEDFTFQIDDAIKSADRHLWIHRQPVNPAETVAMVEDWLNILRWEFSQYWEVDAGNNWYDDSEGTRRYSPEHPRRVGEIFAEGLAILLLEKRLRLPRSRVFFYSGSEARPDFAVEFKRPMQRALVLNRRAYGLEVRSREGWASIRKSDKEQLKKKKANKKFSGVLAIYGSYGRPSPKDEEPRTRILLADPSSKDRKLTLSDVSLVLANHYRGVFRRLGFWDMSEWLGKYVSECGELPKLPVPSVPTAVTMKIGDAVYNGRLFNDLLLQLHNGRITRPQMKQMLDRGYFGRFVFRGVNTVIADLLAERDWEGLESFFDENVDRSSIDERWVSVAGDGTAVIEEPTDGSLRRALLAELDLRSP